MAKQQKDPTAEVEPAGNGEQAAPVAMAPLIPAADMGQQTRVQMARAVAEVQAMVIVAQSNKRIVSEATDDMIRTCQEREMADGAFYDYPRGDGTVTGPTVQLMRALLGCWGNCQSGTSELRRFEPAGGKPGMSEMESWAWDLQKNVRMSTTFFVNWRRDKKTGAVELTTDRDIYENNANQASRRERAMIERILPFWFVEQAKRICQETLIGKPEEFNGRVDDLIAKYAEMGVTRAMLEQRRGVPRPAWRPVDLGRLTTTYHSILRGETDLSEEFPEARRRGEREGSAQATLEAARKAQDEAGEQPPAQSKGRRHSQPQPRQEPLKESRTEQRAERAAPQEPQRPARRHTGQEPRSAGDAWDQAEPRDKQ